MLFEIARPLRALANSLCHGESSATLPAGELRVSLRQRWDLLRRLAGVLGLRYEAISISTRDSNADEIEVLIAARQSAKRNRNFAAADRIRDKLVARGIELIDRPDGITNWRRRKIS